MKTSFIRLAAFLVACVNMTALFAMETSGIVSRVDASNMTIYIDEQRIAVTSRTQFIPEIGEDLAGSAGLDLDLEGKRVFYQVDLDSQGRWILRQLMVSSGDEQ